MMKTLPRVLPLCAALALLVPLLLSGCGGSTGSAPRTSTISANGTVRHFITDGGFYGIDADNGNAYDPNNLSTEFSKDGLRVTFTAIPHPGLVSGHGYGTIIDITKISALKQ